MLTDTHPPSFVRPNVALSSGMISNYHGPQSNNRWIWCQKLLVSNKWLSLTAASILAGLLISGTRGVRRDMTLKIFIYHLKERARRRAVSINSIDRDSRQRTCTSVTYFGSVIRNHSYLRSIRQYGSEAIVLRLVHTQIGRLLAGAIRIHVSREIRMRGTYSNIRRMLTKMEMHTRPSG